MAKQPTLEQKEKIKSLTVKKQELFEAIKESEDYNRDFGYTVGYFRGVLVAFLATLLVGFFQGDLYQLLITISIAGIILIIFIIYNLQKWKNKRISIR